MHPDTYYDPYGDLGTITITLTDYNRTKKIRAIKGVRSLNRLIRNREIGLREAKDAVDTIQNGGQIVFRNVPRGMQYAVEHECRESGLYEGETPPPVTVSL